MAAIEQPTCVWISKEKQCTELAIGQCNMCKLHIIQSLMDEEKIQSKRDKSNQTMVEKPSKKTKKDKDPNKPKKAQTAYMAFCSVNRSKVIEQHPELKQTQIIKRLGELWAEIKENNELNKTYVDMAEADKERYNREIATYSSGNEA